MENFHYKLNTHWHKFHTDVLHYINNQNNKNFTSEQFLNALTEQAIHIVTNGESKYWYQAANYDLLNRETRAYIIRNSTINNWFITFKALPGIMRKAPDFYVYFSIPVDVETIINTLLSNYSTQVSLLKKV